MVGSRRGSPTARQSPDPWRDQFHRVAYRVTKVDRLPAPRPLDFLLDAHAVFFQLLPPGIQITGLDAQGEMPRPLGTVGRKLVALERGFSQKRQEDAGGADPEEDVATGFLADHREAKHVPVERLGLVEVVHVDCGFDDGLDLHGHSSSTSTSFPWTLIGKLRTSSSVSGPSAVPVLTLNSVLCQGHVTTSPTSAPSPNGPPS